ncbi:uncharacterized protein LOC106179092 [Lingula anatina]|uniref:Uncharacterized protein LOC106179092 n=1 Tax=Lingula anatina TaxID=7574 RepID=A0A2R2MP71_LINAN|nr:uncharacterized protein LOC106179092 [Lingula anatina]|eukprot:XP_023932030.1 uncharacterized protein LOC106179092 [Lingula anatina]
MSGLRTSLITFTLGALVVVSTVTSIAHALPSPQSSSNVSTDCISLSQVQISTDYVERPGQGPAAYTGDNVTVTFNVSFSALDASVFDLEVVSLKIPHFTYSNNCASDINNITTCNVTFQSYVEVLNTEVQVVDGVDFLQANSTTITTTPKAVDFSWGSNFADYGNFSNTTLQFTVVLRVNESVTPATSYNFTAAVNTTCDALNYGMVSSSKSLFIGKVDVLINVFSNPQKVQAGDTAHFWIYVRPAESVLGNLTVNQIKVNLGQHTNFLAASLAAPTMTNLSISENVLTTTGFSIGVLGHGPSLDANVDVNVTVKDTVPLGGVAFGGAVTVCATLSFIGAKADGSIIPSSGPSVLCDTVPSADLTLQTGSSTLGLGSTTNIGQVVEATARVTVPKGVLENVKFELAITSDSGSCVPVKFVKGTLTHPAGVTVSGPTDITESGFTVTGLSCSRKRRNAELLSRVKRAPVTVTGQFFLGNIANPASRGSNAVLLGKIHYWVPTNAPTANLAVTGSVEINGYSMMLGSDSTQITQPVLLINKTAQMYNATANPDHILINVTVMHAPSSTGPAYNVKLVEDARKLRVFFSAMTPPTSQLTSIQNDQIMTWTKSVLNVGDVMFMSYEAYPSNNGDDLVKLGDTYFPATLTYDSYDPTSYTGLTVSPQSSTLTTNACATRLVNEIKNLLYQHGLTALSFFLALLLGAAIVFLIVVVYVKVAKNGIGNEVAPSTDNLRHGLITNANQAMKKGYKNIKDQSTVDEEESLVVIHCMGDPLQKNRALDSIDIASTITTDTEIEKQRYKASQQALTMLIESLRKNGDISRQKEEAALKEFMRKVKEMEASMENQYKVAMEEVFRMISIKNKEQITIILKKQKEEKDKLERQMNTASDEEKAEVFEILRKEHDIQQQDAVHLLKLEQDEESEKLRKEFSIKKRAAVKDIQRQCLSQIVEQGELNQQQADWIINEHQKNQEKVDKIYDDEVSRQRAALEEKLTRRRMLASMADGEEDEYSEVLNTLAEQELQVVQKLEKQEIMDEDDAERYREEIAREMLAAKNRYDTERARQEAELKKRLREAKKQKLAEKAKFQQQELDELQKKQKEEQAQDNVDPIALIEKQAIMTSKHRAEMTELENQIDLEQTRELLTLREKVTDETKEQLETNRQAFLDKLKNNGFMEDDQIKQILKQHNLQLNKLELAQQTDREKQQENLQCLIVIL